MRTTVKFAVTAFVAVGAMFGRVSWADTQEEIEQMKQTLADLQKRLASLEEKQKKEEAAKTKAPRPVESGYGKTRIGGLIQNWFMSDNGSGQHETYRLRRLELNWGGDINERVSWFSKIDPAKNLSLNAGPPVSVNQRTNVLQESFITYKFGPQWSANIGQEKIPLSLEGLQSAAQLDTVERALFMTGPRKVGVGFGDVRDTGIQVKGKLKNGDVTLAVLNSAGESQNTTDNNDQKDVGGRFTYRPPTLPGLQVGFSGLSGSFGSHLVRNRLGAELLFKRQGWTLKSEYMTGADQAVAGGPEFDRRGWYVHLGKQMNPTWEVVGRYDYWDPDEGSLAGGTPKEKDLLLGVNYYIEAFHSKLQLNFINKNLVGMEQRRQILLNTQTAW